MEKYYQFIESCRHKLYDGGTHKHHIIPKFMGGDDCVDNIVVLSYEDHLQAHLILADCFPMGSRERHYNLSSAAYISRLVNGKYVDLSGANNPMYGQRRSDRVKKILSDKAKLRFANKENHPMYGKFLSESVKKLISERRIGKYNGSEYDRINFIERLRGNKYRFGIPHTDDVKRRIRESLHGRKKPDGFGEKVSNRLTGIKKTDIHRENSKRAITKSANTPFQGIGVTLKDTVTDIIYPTKLAAREDIGVGRCRLDTLIQQGRFIVLYNGSVKNDE